MSRSTVYAFSGVGRKKDLSVKRLIDCHRRECRKQSPGLMDEYSTNLSSRLASMYDMLDGHIA